MQRIPLKLAQPGMVLAKEAITPEGQVLCGTGTALTQEILARLAKQEVLTLTVEGHPVQLPGEKTLPERLRELDQRFSKVKRDPVLKALKTLIAEFWIIQERGEDFLQNLRKGKAG